jgi:hypothetical protein
MDLQLGRSLVPAVAAILCSGGVESMTRDDGSVTGAHHADLTRT